jgi:hypothetical protein
MWGFSLSVGLITGCMLGLEFVAGENVLIVDLLIVRLEVEWFNEDDLA